MKVAPSYVSKDRLIKKAANRSKERIAEHITMSSAFKPENAKLINENLDPIARYANRHNINVQFEPSVENLGSAKMNVYKREVEWYDPHDGSEGFPYFVQRYAGEGILDKSLDNKKDLLKSFRDEAARILYGNK